MDAPTPICAVTEDGSVTRAGVGGTNGRIGLVYHRDPGSDTVRVVVGHDRAGTLPSGSQVAAMLVESYGPSTPLMTFSISERIVVDRAQQFNDVSEWVDAYWPMFRGEEA